MGDPLHPGIATRFRAALRGEQDARELEVLRAAGAGVYEELTLAEQERAQLVADQRSLWTAPPAVGGHLAATWNAFVLQTLGAGLLDGDYAADTRTVGYVPPVTFELAWSWFSAAAGWLSQAKQARGNPDYDMAAALHLPAPLPPWIDADPCPPVHQHAMLAAITPIREHAELALFDLDKHCQTDAHRHAANVMHQLFAEADAAVEYAEALSGTPAGERLHTMIEAHLRRALDLWFHLGQLAAIPTLIGRYRLKSRPTTVDPQSLPGGLSFDPWCLTEPETRQEWQADPRAQRAIATLWEADPDPAHTLAINAEIQAALAAGSIAPVRVNGQASYHYSCPWPAIYQVRRAVRIAGRRLGVPQQFTFEVSAEKLAEGGEFVRRILRGPFLPTEDLEYGDRKARHPRSSGRR